MRYLVLSDIHANLPALEAVLAAADGAWDRVLVLGDLVGYGAEPNEVVARVRDLGPHAIIRGNHDKVGSGLESADGFNTVARRAIAWTFAELTPEHRAYLAGLPEGPVRIDTDIEICHGAPFDEDAYIFDEMEAVQSLQAMRGSLCLFGHTHVPAHYTLTGDQLDVRGIAPPPTTVIGWPAGMRTLVNCGAVGQPRDGDARAAYGIVDTDTREVRCLRIAYPVPLAQARIVDAGLPEMLATRLALGR